MQITEGRIDLMADFKELLLSTKGPYYNEEDMLEFKAVTEEHFVDLETFKEILANRGFNTLEQLKDLEEDMYCRKLRIFEKTGFLER